MSPAPNISSIRSRKSAVRGTSLMTRGRGCVSCSRGFIKPSLNDARTSTSAVGSGYTGDVVSINIGATCGSKHRTGRLPPSVNDRNALVGTIDCADNFLCSEGLVCGDCDRNTESGIGSYS